MVVVSNELRNLLTEDSLNSIISANSAPNGHLIRKEEKNNVLETDNISNEIASQEKEVNVNESIEKEINRIKNQVQENINKQNSNIESMTSKINDLIRSFNAIESKICNLDKKYNSIESKPKEKEEQTQVQVKEDIAPQSSTTAIPTSNQPPTQAGRGGGNNLPSELSIESIFNCNGKSF